MDTISLCELGNATVALQESFSVIFELPNFQFQEFYEDDGESLDFIRRVSFCERKSAPHLLGQSINFPTCWKVKIRCTDNRVRVGLKFTDHMKRSDDNEKFALIKFKICLVDKDGDPVYKRPWKSWEQAKQIYAYEEYSMPDFISVLQLFDNQKLYMPNKTLRLLCEGVLYNVMNSTTNFGEYRKFRDNLISKPYLRNDVNFSDLKLVAENGAVFLTNKFLLANASQALRSLTIAISQKEKDKIPSLHLDNLSESEASKMLEFINTGTIMDQDWTDYDQVEKLLALAKDYELKNLTWLCYSKLVKTMDITEFPALAKLFYKNRADSRFLAALNKFYMKNQLKLVQRESFKKFAKDDKDAFLYVVLFTEK